MVNRRQALRISLGLAGAGAVIGAASGVLAFTAALAYRFGIRALFDAASLWIIPFPAALGACVGAARAGPRLLGSYSCRVSIGRMLLWTAVGRHHRRGAW